MHKFSATVESTFGSSCRLSVRGGIVAETNDSLLEAVEGLIHQGFREVDVDLGGVDYISSSGISVFLELQTLAERHGAVVRVSAITPKVQELLRLAGVVQLPDIFAPGT